MTQRAAVLGSPIDHSLSPVLHTAGYRALGLDFEYSKIECTAEQLPGIVAASDYIGFSVTMPCKFAAWEFADELTDRARAIGSANTLVRQDGGWLADNTDCLGVLGALSELGIELSEVTLIGAGGTARAVIWALGELGVKRVRLLNRSDRAAELHGIADIDITWSPLDSELRGDAVINTVPSAALPQYQVDLPVFDVIYDPWPTPLVAAAPKAVGGHIMLAHQAYAQFKLFTGHRAPTVAMRAALMQELGLD